MTRVFGIAGTSGSGKTVLMERLIATLVGQGIAVNAIKHSHHDVQIDPPGKDSHRFRVAGASEVMLVSPWRFAIVHELRGSAEPTLTEQLQRLSPAELTLVEGFSRLPIPKLEVWRDENGKPPRYVDDPHIIALATDDGLPATHSLARFGLDDVAAMAQFVLDHAVDAAHLRGL
ncbi:molybdopterin-guanine dinucleotide biosynthesis protein B [Uliginosibacterium sp. sgz301328]|uniref:molybdopterin-guanine dinucleotide biosynthesis protein B n=1 Tax=Uliginosibacterium sp. sgz301328 TaxID=3243764 RepID=UPI00359ED70A